MKVLHYAYNDTWLLQTFQARLVKDVGKEDFSWEMKAKT